jgi:zinc transporter 1/2/3
MLHLLPEALEELGQIKMGAFPIALAVTIGIFALFTLVELLSVTDDGGSCCETRREHVICPLAPDSGAYDCLPRVGHESGENESRFGEDMGRFDAASVSFYSIVSIESAVEGLAVGVLQRWPKVFAILCAIIAHKPVEACAVALVVLKRRPTKLGFCLLVALYGVMAPIGVGIGILLQRIESPAILGVIESATAGAFIFMGCREWMELFTQKFVWRTAEKLVHYGAFVLGILWLCAVAIVKAITGV